MGKMKLLVLERPWFSDNFQVCGVGVRQKKKKKILSEGAFGKQQYFRDSSLVRFV